MKHFAIFPVVLSMMVTAASATTVTTLVEARIDLPDLSGGQTVSEAIDTNDGVTEQDLLASTDTGQATAKIDASTLSFDLASQSANFGGDSTPSAHWARSRTEMASDYRAVGDGTVFLSLDVTSFGFLQTDRDDGLDLIHTLAGFEVVTPSETIFKRTSNLDPANLIFGSVDYGVTEALTASFTVADGDVFSLRLFALADTGDFPQTGTQRDLQLSMFWASAEVRGQLGLLAQNTVLIPIDDSPAPVPLPAGLPLLMAGLGGFAYVRKGNRGVGRRA